MINAPLAQGRFGLISRGSPPFSRILLLCILNFPQQDNFSCPGQFQPFIIHVSLISALLFSTNSRHFQLSLPGHFLLSFHGHFQLLPFRDSQLSSFPSSFPGYSQTLVIHFPGLCIFNSPKSGILNSTLQKKRSLFGDEVETDLCGNVENYPMRYTTKRC